MKSTVVWFSQNHLGERRRGWAVEMAAYDGRRHPGRLFETRQEAEAEADKPSAPGLGIKDARAGSYRVHASEPRRQER
jgi:hypothetical protein